MPDPTRRDGERGSSTVDFVLVGALLTVLTLGVLQLGMVIHVRNIVHDAAVEGAHHAALADASLADGVERTRLVISRAVGARYAEDITARHTSALGHSAIEIRVRTVLPLVGLLGIERGLEVSAHAPAEGFDD